MAEASLILSRKESYTEGTFSQTLLEADPEDSESSVDLSEHSVFGPSKELSLVGRIISEDTKIEVSEHLIIVEQSKNQIILTLPDLPIKDVSKGSSFICRPLIIKNANPNVDVKIVASCLINRLPQYILKGKKHTMLIHTGKEWRTI